MPKYISDKEANLMRATGRAKHVPEASRRLREPEKDQVAEAIARMADVQETMAGVLSEVAVASRVAPAPPAPQIVRMEQPNVRPPRMREFLITRDEDGRMKSINVTPDKIELRIERDGEGRMSAIRAYPKT